MVTDYMTIQEFAEYVRVSVNTVRRWIKLGTITTYKIGRRHLISKIEIPTFMREDKFVK